MILLDGKLVSTERLHDLKQQIKRSALQPGLAVVRIGEDPASKIYVSKKIKACQDIGFFSEEIHLSENCDQKTVADLIQRLNHDPRIHGILIQLPLPKHLPEQSLLELIHPKKDVDGFHPVNRGKLMAGSPCHVPCTPRGIMSLLAHFKINLVGLRSLVIGRSLIVGRPMSLLLDQAGCTVTVAHSKTKDMSDHLMHADLIVAAIGKADFLANQPLKKNVILIDVGINRLPNGKIVGDINLDAYKGIASAGTPVPGGVGPMTICTLLENTWDAFQMLK